MSPIAAFLPARLALRLEDYPHPRAVALAGDLSLAEKRQLLAAWASDAHALEGRPAFRWLPGTPGPVPVDHVLAALAQLDGEDRAPCAHIAVAARQPDRSGTRVN
jgi:hypothetical protein